MTLIQFILAGSLAFLVVYLYKRTSRSIMDALLVVMFGATGIVFVFFPDLTNRIARWVGVGRGADMIFYLAIVFFLFVVAKLYGRIRKLEQQLTEIVRDESIRKAREGTSKGKQEDSNP